MKFVDEFRDQGLAAALAKRIATESAGHDWKVMEVCGGHTHTIYKYGIEDLLPPNVELVHGPGCPVCVIPMGRVDDGIAVAKTGHSCSASSSFCPRKFLRRSMMARSARESEMTTTSTSTMS